MDPVDPADPQHCLKITISDLSRKEPEPELEPEPQFVFLALAPGGNLILTPQLRLRNTGLKVPKREIFDRSDFPDFYTIT